jgi:hypothetical protein
MTTKRVDAEMLRRELGGDLFELKMPPADWSAFFSALAVAVNTDDSEEWVAALKKAKEIVERARRILGENGGTT